jgi:transcriptional regulator with XRE-family HTH domain
MTDALDWDALVREAKRRRAKEGLSQLKHAQLAGVSRDTIRSFDKYERSISLEKATAILRVVGLVVDERTGGGGVHADFVRRARERWDDLVRPLPERHPARFPYGRVVYDYELRGDVRAIETAALENLLSDVTAEGGFRIEQPFDVYGPKRHTVCNDEEIEYWESDPQSDIALVDHSLAGYWRASGRGSFLLIRAYPEDDEFRNMEPGTFLDVALPLWRAADVLEHATLIAKSFPGQVEEVVVHATWDGLAGRRLVNWSRATAASPMRSEHRSRVSSVSNALGVDIGKGDAPENLLNLLAPLYAAFDFDLRVKDIIDELARRSAKSKELVRAR